MMAIGEGKGWRKSTARAEEERTPTEGNMGDGALGRARTGRFLFLRGVGMTSGIVKGQAQFEPWRWEGARNCVWVGGQVYGNSWILLEAGEFWGGRGAMERRRRIFFTERRGNWGQGRDMSGCTLIGARVTGALGRALRDWSNPGGARGPA